MADTSLIFNILARDKTSGTFDKIKGAAAAAGVAVGAALMAGAMAAMDKSRLDNKVASQLGATPAQAKELGKLSSQTYAAGFGEDMPAVTTAIRAAAQNGLIDVQNASSETAKIAVKNLLTVGDTLEEDAERTSAAVSQMLRTGLAKSSEEAMDLLVKATQNGVNKSQDLLDTMNEYGTQFRKLGLDGPHAMGLMSQAIKAGARDSDTAADAIKEFSLIGASGSGKAAAGFKALGLDAKQMTKNIAGGGDMAAESFNSVLERLRAMKDPVKQNATAVALFGTKAEDLGQSLFAMNLDTAEKQMEGFKGATGRAATTAAQGASSWSTLGREFQMSLIDKMNLALPAVNAVMGFMQRNSSWVGPLATGLAALAVAVGIITAVQWAWNAALALWPGTWIIAGILVLVGVIVLVATKTKFFQTIWGGVWGFMKMIGSWFAGPFAGFFVTSWGKITASLGRAKNQIGGAITGIKNFFVGWWNLYYSIATKIINKGVQLVSWFQKLPGRIGGSLKNVFSGLWSGFRGNVNKIVAGWNNLSFGIPGFSFAGISVPGISVGTPNIPYLDKGAGMVRQEGLAYIHRGEKITPSARVTPYRSNGGGGGATVTIASNGNKMSNMLLELLREAIRDKGGDPVKVLTPA